MRKVLVRYKFGETLASPRINISRPTEGYVLSGPTIMENAVSIQWVGYEAWRNAGFVRRIADRYYGLTSDDVAAKAFDPNSIEKVNQQYDKILKSLKMGRRMVYWFGDYHENIVRIPHNRNYGFAKIERQGVSGQRAIGIAQEMANRGIYACIHDLNVIPEHQGRGFGTVLAYVGLS